ncbi:MAG: rRNA pseudouridine synthase [Clostridia bacterium]|nr:rRNA pseudouridine synthase [Clostridia bacterium]
MRINKYLAQAGIASRRKADELIADGRVKVNRLTLREPGYDVKEGDLIEVDGKAVTVAEEKVYLAINKPVGYVTTVSDQFGRPTVLDLVTDIEARLFPVGRLDYETSGLLFLTNDGDFAYRMTHPKHELGKTYRARVQGFLSRERLAKLRKGVDIGGFTTSPATVEIVRELPKQTIVDITVHEGKYHQVRRMFKAVGNQVVELERIAIGDVRLGRLTSGGYRKLTKEEMKKLGL